MVVLSLKLRAPNHALEARGRTSTRGVHTRIYTRVYVTGLPFYFSRSPAVTNSFASTKFEYEILLYDSIRVSSSRLIAPNRSVQNGTIYSLPGGG